MSDFKIGEHVMVKLSGGRLVDAEIKAVIETTEGKRLQVKLVLEKRPPGFIFGRLSRSCDKTPE